MKKVVRLGGKVAEDWTRVMLNGVAVGEVIKYSHGTVGGHSYIGRRGNQWEVTGAKTLSDGANNVAEVYLEQLAESLAEWTDRAKAVGLISVSKGG